MDQVSAEVLEYQVLKDQIEDLEKRKKVLRDSLMETVQEVGESDDQGHLWLDLDTEVNGVGSVQAERRVSQTLNEDRALALIEKRGLTETCTKLVRVVDEDAVLAAKFEDHFTEEDIDSMFDFKVVWALKLK